MSDRELVISFGGTHPAKIVRVERLTWPSVVQIFLQKAPEREDKAVEGWYSFAEFDPEYRDSDNLVARHALTFDFDHITLEDVKTIQKAYVDLEYIVYTTASHNSVCDHKDCHIKGTAHPRLRVIMPLSRPVGYDEFQAVSRKVAARAGIELASRETHVPAQMMYMPTRKVGGVFSAKHHPGAWLDVDEVLAEYTNWTDRAEWPKRRDADSVHGKDATVSPLVKAGVVGAFCRAFSIEEAIERFELPYIPAVQR